MLVLLLVIVLLSVAVVCAVKLSPLVFTLSEASQLYPDATLLLNTIAVELPLQIVAEDALVIAGCGFTLTVMVCAVPAQLPPLDVGVTV